MFFYLLFTPFLPNVRPRASLPFDGDTSQVPVLNQQILALAVTSYKNVQYVCRKG